METHNKAYRSSLGEKEWRPIPGYPGYEVTDDGLVRSWKVWRRSPTPRLLTQRVDGNGYPYVHLTPGPRRTYRLVALAFLGPRPDGMETRHLDGDRMNVHVSNIRYGTASENNLDAVAHGTHNQASKTHCPQSHPYDEENTGRYPSRPGRRRCLKCWSLQRKAKRAALRKDLP